MNGESSPARMWVLLGISCVLILLSLTFSAAESAFLSINRLRVRFLRNKKDKRAVRVWRLLNNKERLINTLLVANNIVNITLSAILTYLAMKLFGNAGIGLATFAGTLLLLVFGEITPKTIATHHPEPFAFFISGFIVLLEFVLAPVVVVLTGISRLALGMCGVRPQKKAVTFTEEEIKTFIEVGGETGVIANDEKAMMHRVFKFTDLAAKDIMIPRKDIIAVPLDANYKQIVELSERFRLTRFPVYRKDIDDIVGTIYIKDLLFYKDSESDFSVRTVMRPPLFILETKKMSSIQNMLRENRQSLAVVIDEYSGTNGILTSEDIVREIFGSINDEYKPYAHRVEMRIHNPHDEIISGLFRLIDLNEQLQLHLHSKYSETIGGYLCEVLGHIPKTGESIEREGFVFSVIRMEDKRVAQVRVYSQKEAEQ